VAESNSFDLFLSEEQAEFRFEEFYRPALVDGNWDDVIRAFPELDLLIEWSAPVLSRTRYNSFGEPWSTYRIGGGRMEVSVFGPPGLIGTMVGRVDGLSVDVKDVWDRELNDGEWTYATGGPLKMSRGLARYLGVRRTDVDFWIDVFPDDEHTTPDEPVRHFRMSCCFDVEFGVTLKADEPPPVPEAPTPALTTLGVAAVAWLVRRRNAWASRPRS
jgi:uncharacterized protein (TIGR03382 family)